VTMRKASSCGRQSDHPESVRARLSRSDISITRSTTGDAVRLAGNLPRLVVADLTCRKNGFASPRNSAARERRKRIPVLHPLRDPVVPLHERLQGERSESVLCQALRIRELLEHRTSSARETPARSPANRRRRRRSTSVGTQRLLDEVEADREISGARAGGAEGLLPGAILPGWKAPPLQRVRCVDRRDRERAREFSVEPPPPAPTVETWKPVLRWIRLRP